MVLIVRSISVRYADGHVIASHRHDWGQLVFAASGAIAVVTPEAEWLVPPARAVWLPPLVPHRLQMRGAAWLRTIYLSPGLAVALPDTGVRTRGAGAAARADPAHRAARTAG